jgi:hypothetical protein
MRNISITVLFVLATMFTSGKTFARSVPHRSSPSTTPGTYGVAGCGLGSMVFHDQRGPVQIFAATLNGTGVQTFGITTGTSNCNDGQNLIKAYIDTNHDALKVAAARGEGEVIVGLAKVYNCSDSAALSQALKTNYQDVFKTNDVDQTKQQIDNVIEKTPALQSTCQA